jgi:methionyl-tRNA formyltransferase
LGIDVFQPTGLREDALVLPLREANPDVLVVVAYGELLRASVLELAPHGALNVHPSLLPLYRGATPIPSAILAGDRVTGTSIIKLVRRLDAGPVVARQELDIMTDDTAGTLADRLARQAAGMLPGVVLDWVAGRIHARDQEADLATYCREWARDDARIDWNSTAVHIERLVRAANPWPLAWTTLDGASLAIHGARVAAGLAHRRQPGQLRIDAALALVDTADGTLQLDVVQPAGKRPMPAADWLRGLRGSELMLGS